MKTKQVQSSTGGRWAVVIVVLIFLSIISFISALIIGIFISTSETEPAGNVAHIRITGPILANAGRGFGSVGKASSTEITRLIKKAGANPDVKAMLFEINSPGGTAVASYEIADAISKTNKTTVAWIREGGLSGAYWAATAADHIVANPMSAVGSIGVISSYLEFSGTLERYNASYQRLVSGEYKDMGSPWKDMTPQEEQIMQGNLDMIRNMFVDEVAKNRKLSRAAVDKVADGRFFIGKESLELGLVDELGGKDEAVAWIEKKEGIKAELAEYEPPKTFGEMLFSALDEHGYFMGMGIGDSISAGSESVGLKT